jgi:hypothetical protein
MTALQPKLRIAVPIPLTPHPRRWNTLEWLRASRAAILALDALLLIAVLVGANVHHQAMQAIGHDSAPSIIAAQKIKSALADMDAEAANELLSPAGSAAAADLALYEKHRTEAASALIEAAKNITYGNSELEPILAVQVSLGQYERFVQQARDFHRRGDPAFLDAYRAAAQVMDERLLPAADRLDDANDVELEKAYKNQSTRSVAARTFVLLSGLLSVVVLLAIQVFLSRRTRRTFNPLLAAATLLAFGLTAYALSAFETERTQLKIAREDAFTSIHALGRARAIAFEANGLESRSLLDAAHAVELQSAFNADADRIAHLPPGSEVDDVLRELSKKDGRVEGFTGLLADELNNITFDGEREAAVKSLGTWETYLGIDAQLRQLARAGQTQKAVELCVGKAPGESDWAFEQFDQALGATLDLNQAAFDRAVKTGFDALEPLDLAASIVTALIAVLSVLGMQPRLREYE